MRSEEFERAIGELTTAIGFNTSDAQTYLYRAMAYGRIGEHGMELNDVARAFSIDPQVLGVSGEDAAFPLAFGQSLVNAVLADPQAWTRITGENSEMILFIADKLIKSKPEVPMGYLLRALVSIAREEWDRALVECNTVIELAPDSYVGYWVRANVRWLLDEDEEAIDDCDTCINLASDNPDAYLLRGQILSFGHQPRNVPRAVEDLTIALDLYGEPFTAARAHCYLLRAKALLFEEDAGRCLEDVTTCLKLMPDEEIDQRVEAYSLKAGILLEQEEFRASIEDAGEGIRLSGGEDAERTAFLHCIRAEASVGMGELVRAHDDYDAVIRLSSDPELVEKARSRKAQIPRDSG